VAGVPVRVGFDACIVYDNASVDRTPDIVRAFGRHFDVRLKNWPTTEADAQPEAYEDCLAYFGFEFQWIAFIDADELIVPRRGDVRDLIAANADASAIVVNWAIFGSSGTRRGRLV
jgi:glycosyltransferase involved in cell wall biosynthesis